MPDNKINLAFALGLSPENAMQYFQSKGYAFSWDWRDLFQSEHDKAFTVAKMTRLDLLMDVRGLVDEAIAGKITPREFYLSLEEKLKEKGWWGKQDLFNPVTGELENVQLGSPRRMKTILETNMNVSYSAGKYKTQIDAASFAPWWRYRDQEDDRVRVTHHRIGELFKSAVLHYKNPWWNIWYPPNDWGCRCWVENYTEAEVEQRGFEKLTSVPDIFGQPAEGWAHNPGLAWQPDLTRYPKELIKDVGLNL